MKRICSYLLGLTFICLSVVHAETIVSGVKILNTMEELVDPQHSLLLVVDMQNAMISTEGICTRTDKSVDPDPDKHTVRTACGDQVKNIQKILKAARKAGLPVAYAKMIHQTKSGEILAAGSQRWWTRNMEWMHNIQEGTWDAQVVDELAPQEGDIVIEKTRGNIFYNTDFDDLLKERGIKSIILTGTATCGCVMMSANGAVEHGYYAVYVKDCLDQQDDPVFKWLEKSMPMYGSEDIIAVWEDGADKQENLQASSRSDLPAALEKEDVTTDQVLITTDGRAAAEIILPAGANDVLQNAAITLQQEIERRTDVQLPIQTEKSEGVSTSIHLGTLGTNSKLVKALEGIEHEPVRQNDPGKEGFVLASGIREDGSGIVVINGCDNLGTFHGVGWLLRRMRFSEKNAACPSDLNVRTAPAAPMRGIRFGDAQGYINTEPEGWREIWTDYILWGLSAATYRCDPAHLGDPRASEPARDLWERWTVKVDLAESMGLNVVHLTQTNLVARDGEFGPDQIPNFKEINYMAADFNGINPKFPRGWEVLLEFRNWFFDNMPRIEKVDLYLTSGNDSGGCLDPEIAPWSVAYAEMWDRIYPLLEARNPNARLIFSLYGIPAEEHDALAAKFQSGYRPNWLYCLEFTEWNGEKALLFPKDVPKVIFPVSATVYDTFYQDSGFNPCPRFCENSFRTAWDQHGIQHGTMAYSEGSQDYLNHILLMQMAWDPNRPVEEILDEACRYYFGDEAAPIVKELALLFEQESIDLVSSQWKKPRTTPENIRNAGQLVARAEKVMPAWALASRQWEMVIGRAGISRTRLRQGELLEEFDAKWTQYQAIRSAPAIGSTHIELMDYFQSVLDNALDMERIMDRVSRKGFYPLGGMNFMVGPMGKTGDAVEALAVLESIGARRGKPEATGRWCIAALDENGNLCLNDGYHNRDRSGQVSLDTHLVITDINGEGINRVIFTAKADRNLYAWRSSQGGPIEIAQGNFWSGPLATGDLDGDGKVEIILMSGDTAADAQLTVVTVDGKVHPLNIIPGGSKPIEAPRNLIRVEVQPSKSTVLPLDPHVVICDLDGDGKDEIICSDAKDNHKLVVLDGEGNKKPLGPKAPSGALAAGNLAGDDRPEIVFADAEGNLSACSAMGEVLNFQEKVCPRWLSSVVVAQLEKNKPVAVVYIDEAGFPRSISVNAKSRRLSELHTSVAVGPGMAVGDFDGDDSQDVMYLRSRLDAYFPLCKLSYVDGAGALRDQSNYMPGGFIAAPYGPQAAGRMRFK